MTDQVGHWDTIKSFVERKAPTTWVDGEDRLRVGAYDMYEAIYWTAPEAFQITMRGQEGDPVYVPSGRQVVDTARRYMAPGLQMAIDPAFGGSTTQIENAALWMKDFTAREEFYSKFSGAKLRGLMRGDWLFHIMADPNKPEDSRISIHELNPSNYFPEFQDGDVAKINRVIIAEPVQDGDDTRIHRIVYVRDPDTLKVTVFEDLCEIDEWGQPGTDMAETIVDSVAEELELPDPINQIPVYHFPNEFEEEIGWGSSEMRGIELLMRGINQSVTDQELALVLDGIGVYVTTAGAPLNDETGEEMPWTVAVGHVLELPEDKDFKRVQGVGTIQPYLDHLGYLHDQIDATTGGNDITRGRAEVAIAESGIALALRMGPVLARMVEKEIIVTERLQQMFFDLRSWIAAYEGLEGVLDLRWMPVYADKLPVNRKEVFDQVMTLIQGKIISTREGRRRLVEIGWKFSTDAILEQEIADDIAVTADAEALRLGIETIPPANDGAANEG